MQGSATDCSYPDQDKGEEAARAPLFTCQQLCSAQKTQKPSNILPQTIQDTQLSKTSDIIISSKDFQSKLWPDTLVIQTTNKSYPHKRQSENKLHFLSGYGFLHTQTRSGFRET